MGQCIQECKSQICGRHHFKKLKCYGLPQFFLETLENLLFRISLLKIYKSFIRSLPDYGNVIYDQ